MSNFYNKYFQTHLEYPNPALTKLEPGVLFSYISATFLNGYVNYTGPTQKAFLMHRYQSSDIEAQERLAKYQDFNANPDFHTKLHQIGGDDVIMLTKAENGQFWFYWWDCDVSDCQIGILNHADPDQVVADFGSFVNFIQDNYCDRYLGGTKRIPLSIDPKLIRGWVSF